MNPRNCSYSNSGITPFLHSAYNYWHFIRLPVSWRSIVFYAESGQDWHHFSPIIDYCCTTLGQKVCYISSDRNDPGLIPANDNVRSFYMKAGLWQILFFQFLRADVLVLTMIDLQLFHLKRSIHPVHYIYIFHSISSTHMVDYENSYDHYDSIFCVGPFQVAEIRKREELKHLPAKHLFEHGYTRLEQLYDQGLRHHTERSCTSRATVLLAPTWGPNTILHLHGQELIAILVNAGYRVIVRPHYQTMKLAPGVVSAIREKYGENPLVSFVTAMGETQSLFDSDVLICDWSSISIEYSLGLEKPVLFIDLPRRQRNETYTQLGIEPMEVQIRPLVGTIIPPSNLQQVPAAIERLRAAPDQFKQQIRQLRSSLIFNFGSSLVAAAMEICRIAREKRQNSSYARN
ncbi:MAG: CDP-glycerol glycerophosphotransferase family protein [Chitinivibrionales bacterium]|nr:CDP-glycerol glycerophosphotransferase family protein [Chitinivibrionales bacterium]